MQAKREVIFVIFRSFCCTQPHEFSSYVYMCHMFRFNEIVDDGIIESIRTYTQSGSSRTNRHNTYRLIYKIENLSSTSCGIYIFLYVYENKHADVI